MHFLSRNFASRTRLPARRVAMRVRVVSRGQLMVDPGPRGLEILEGGTELCPLPDGVEVVDSEGNEVPALGTFHVTTETIDPYHLLTDLF